LEAGLQKGLAAQISKAKDKFTIPERKTRFSKMAKGTIINWGKGIVSFFNCAGIAVLQGSGILSPSSANATFFLGMGIFILNRYANALYLSLPTHYFMCLLCYSQRLNAQG
jgi:uncharacterized membrane protein YjjP (DUF1212 family)